MRCMVGHGARGTRRVVMTAGDRGASVSEGWSTDMAGLSMARRSNRAGTGSASVTVHGASFGRFVSSPFLRLFGSGSESSLWSSETAVVCAGAAAARGTRRIALSAGTTLCSFTTLFSIDSSTSSVKLSNSASYRSAHVLLHGQGFTSFSLSSKSRIGFSASECSEWHSDSSMMGRSSDGIRSSRRVTITVGERTSSSSSLFSIDAPSLSFGTRQNRASTGSVSVTLLGFGFGNLAFTGTFQIGFSRCSATSWRSQSSILCNVAHGIESTKRAVVTVGDQAETATETFTVDLFQSVLIQRSNAASTGSLRLTIYGSGLGQLVFSNQARFGSSSCESTQWVSETSMVGRVSHGTQGSRRVTFTAGEISGTMTDSLSIDSALMSVVIGANRALTGSSSVTVAGSGLGLADYSGRMRIGKTTCEASIWDSETSVKCLLGYSSAVKVVGMTIVQRVGSVSPSWSVDEALLSTLRRENRPGTGSAFVTVHGSNMGLVSHTGSTREGQTGCEASEWQSDTSLRCMVGHGAMGTRRVVITTEQTRGSLSQGWSWDSPVLSLMRQINRPGSGSASITVHGVGIGVTSLTAIARVGRTTCQISAWESDTSVRCNVGSSVHGSRRTVLTVTRRAGSFTHAWSVETGSISSIIQRNRASTGATRLTLLGSALGNAAYTSALRSSESACEATEWASQTTLLCMLGHARGRGSRRVVMTTGERSGSSSAAWTADVGGLSSVKRGNHPPKGVTEMLDISNLGSSQLTVRVRQSASAAEHTVWLSSSSISGKCAAGVGRTRSPILTAGVSVASLSQSLSYDSPKISKLYFNVSILDSNSTNSSNSRLTTITLIGHGFGHGDYTPRFSLGESAVEASDWISGSSIACKFVEQSISATRVSAVTSGSQVLATALSLRLRLPKMRLIER